jgi:AcrR family transcriptional regulator
LSRSDEIQSAAIELFYKQGYSATSLKEIADMVNLRAPSLYNHIESKQKLLQDIMFDGIDSLIAAFDEAVAQSDDVLEKVRLASQALVRHNIRRQKQAYVNTYEIPSLEGESRDELIRRRRSYIDRWVKLIESGVSGGLIVVSEPMLTTFNIIDLGAGLSRWYRPGGRWTEEKLVAHYGRLTLSMLV